MRSRGVPPAVLRREPDAAEYEVIRGWLRREAGIALGEGKRALVAGRLWRRLAASGCAGYRDYLDFILDPANSAERQQAIDLLTTNETHFFREPRHLEVVAREAAAHRAAGSRLHAWSAACSSGQEPYSIAMVLASTLGNAWDVLATDLSTRALERARRGHYPIEQARPIPGAHLRAWCLRGTGPQAGTFLVSRALRERVTFRHANLLDPLPGAGPFDIVFLRNVLIYFDSETKQRVVSQVGARVRPGGLLVLGHAETFAGARESFVPEGPSVYRRARQ